MKKLIKFPQGFASTLIIITLVAAGFTLVHAQLASYVITMLNLDESASFALSTTFIILLFALPVVGCYITQYLLGYFFSTIVCLSLAITGLYTLCFQTAAHFYIGIAALSVGNAIGIANLYIMLGRTLKQQPQMLMTGYTLMYTLMNAAALIMLSMTHTIVTNWGYQSCFLISAVLYVIALFILLFNIRNFRLVNRTYNGKFGLKQRVIGIACLVALIPMASYLMQHTELNALTLIISTIVALYFISKAIYDADFATRKKIFTFFIITLFGMTFWILYALQPNLINVFVEHKINHSLSGFSVPAGDFLRFNPLCIVILGSIFSTMWLYLYIKKHALALPYTFSIGIGLLGFAYLLLSTGAQWSLISYILICAAELLIIPTGFVMINKYAPKNCEAYLIGIWLLSNAFGIYVANSIYKLTVNPYQSINPIMTDRLLAARFYEFGLIAIALSLTLTLLAPKLQRLTQNNTHDLMKEAALHNEKL